MIKKGVQIFLVDFNLLDTIRSYMCIKSAKIDQIQYEYKGIHLIKYEDYEVLLQEIQDKNQRIQDLLRENESLNNELIEAKAYLKSDINGSRN